MAIKIACLIEVMKPTKIVLMAAPHKIIMRGVHTIRLFARSTDQPRNFLKQYYIKGD